MACDKSDGFQLTARRRKYVRDGLVFLGLCLVWLLSAPSNFGEPAAPAIHPSNRISKPEFSIVVPVGWKEIPRSLLDEIERLTVSLAPTAPPQHYAYGFQPSAAIGKIEFPYILIQIKNAGRMPRSQLEKIDRYPVQDLAKKNAHTWAPLFTVTEIGRPYYDETAKIIWLQSKNESKEIGGISSLAAIIPTRQGALSVLGYSKTANFPTESRIFHDAAMSVILMPNFMY